MDQKTLLFLVLFAIAFLLMLVTAFSRIPGPLKIFLLLIALFFDMLAFLSRYYTYMLLQFITQRKREIVLEPGKPYYISSGEDAIIHLEKGGDITATIFISIPVYRSSTEMSNTEKLDFARQISKIVSYSSYPIRFTSELFVMNKDDYIKRIKDAIAEYESGMFMETDKNNTRIVTGKLDMLRNMLEHVSAANSMELVTFASLSAKGFKEEDTVASAQQKARELISGISSTFGVPASIITGNELLKFIEPEFLIPYSTTEEKIKEAIKHEVL